MSIAATALRAFRSAAAGRFGASITFTRNGASVAVSALAGAKQYLVSDAQGLQTTFSSHDFLAAAEDLVLDGTQIEPQRGDVITRTVGSKSQRFQVAFPDRTQPPFRWSDSEGAVLRIHTSLMGSEDA